MSSAEGSCEMVSHAVTETCQPDSEVLILLVFRHELTNLAGEGRFPKELLDKLQEVKVRKDLVLAVDPHDINVADVKGFVLEQLQMTKYVLLEMIVTVENKAVQDTDFISDLISRGDLKKTGTAYTLEYIFVPAHPQLLTCAEQQNFLDSLTKDSTAERISTSPAASSCSSTLSSSSFSFCGETTPEPEPTKPPKSVTVTLQSPLRSQSVLSTSGSSMSAGTVGGKKKAPRKRPHSVKSSVSPEIPTPILPRPVQGLMMAEPEAKRVRMWVPNMALAALRNVSGGTVMEHRGVGQPAQMLDNGPGRVVNVPIMPASNGLAPLKPKLASPEKRAVPVPPVPVPVQMVAPDPSRRWNITTRQLILMTQLAEGHKRVTITFEDDNGVQTVCVENRDT